MKPSVSLLFVCLLIAGCDAGKEVSPPHDPMKVGFITLENQPIKMSVVLPGRTSAIRSAEVRPQVSGILLRRLFREGSDVKAGQQLYQIDPDTYEAALEKAQAQLTNDNDVLKRYQTLIKSNAVSKQTLDAAMSDYLQAKADVKTAKVNLEYTRVLAPISGRIGRSSVTEGALVTDGQSTALATITQLDPIYVDVSQPSSELLRIRRAVEAGQLRTLNPHEAAVRLTLEDGTTYPEEGRLEFSEVQVDEGTGTVTLRAQFPNPQGVLLPGMFVHSEIEQGVEAQGLMVPQDAIMRNNKGNAYVYIIGEGNKVIQQMVKTGVMKNGDWQITEGLKAGERVIVDGLQKTAPGNMVIPQPYQFHTLTASSVPSVSLSMTDPSAQ